MGYYTAYNLEIIKRGPKLGDDSFDEHDPFGEEVGVNGDPIATLRNFSESARWAIDEEGNYNDSCKWYESNEDMKKLSSMYPGWIFKLHGEGEENDDLWNHYYKDGKSQYCRVRMTYDPYDENKLK